MVAAGSPDCYPSSKGDNVFVEQPDGPVNLLRPTQRPSQDIPASGIRHANLPHHRSQSRDRF